ncbi:MAG: CBS domain-containing protein [Bacteroidetes bacterium]|nr:CBS domain-containing protein [Bacteroidota bacterium]
MEYLDDELSHYLEPVAKSRTPFVFDDILTRPIRDLNLVPATLIGHETSLAEAIGIMQTRKFGALLVTREGHLAGIFTERDILNRLIGNSVDLADTPVADYMTPNPESLHDEDAIVYAMNKMVVGGYRHIPIVDSQGLPVSVLSIRDVVSFICSFCDSEVLNLPPQPLRKNQSREGA